MKKHPKLIQSDKRGQIVIPKEVRNELGINEDSGFYVYVIPGEGILLKQVEPPNLDGHVVTNELKKHADKIDLDKNNVDKTVQDYKKTKGGLEDL